MLRAPLEQGDVAVPKGPRRCPWEKQGGHSTAGAICSLPSLLSPKKHLGILRGVMENSPKEFKASGTTGSEYQGSQGHPAGADTASATPEHLAK